MYTTIEINNNLLIRVLLEDKKNKEKVIDIGGKAFVGTTLYSYTLITVITSLDTTYILEP